MAYKRKTYDLFEIQGRYGCGWEVVTTETSFREAKDRIREYRENELGVSFRIKTKRMPVENTEKVW